MRPLVAKPTDSKVPDVPVVFMYSNQCPYKDSEEFYMSKVKKSIYF